MLLKNSDFFLKNMKKLNIFPSSNLTKYIIFLLSILLKFSTLSFENADQIFPVVKDLKPIKNSPTHCSCHKNEELSKMMAVKFSSGNKYLISPQILGEGATAMVFHAIFFGEKWQMTANTPTNCVAIKMADSSESSNKNLRIEKELAILKDIFLPHDNSKLPPPSHNLSFLRSESFLVKKREHFAIVMELGEQNLYEYWQKAMAHICSGKRCFYQNVSETMLLYIMREISIGLHQLHQRNYIFIDLKPENVMIMPNSPNPKALYEGNCGRLRIKLSDFGTAIKFDPEIGKRELSDYERKYLMCSKFYWAPELFDVTDEISLFTDIYSLGRVMLMLAVQTPQIKKSWNKREKNFVEIDENFIDLVVDMLEAEGIIPAPINFDDVPEIFYESDSDIEKNSEIVEVEKKEKKLRKEKEAEEKGKEKEKAEKYKKNLRELYRKMKKNFGHLMEIIEQTQATEQEQRPTALIIIEKFSPKLAHLERIQSVEKSIQHSSNLNSGALISGSLTDISGSSVRRGSSLTRSFKRGISKRFRHLSLDNFKFFEQKSAQLSSNPNSGALINRKSTDDISAGNSIRRKSSLTRNLKQGIKKIRRLSLDKFKFFN